MIGYLINRTPSTLLNGKTPFEMLHDRVPPFTQLKIFCCLAFVHDHSLPKDKFRARSRPCVFIGYPFGKKGWRCFDPQENKFSIRMRFLTK